MQLLYFILTHPEHTNSYQYRLGREQWTNFLQHQTKQSKISRVQWWYLSSSLTFSEEMERDWSAALCYSQRVFDFFAAFLFSGQWKVQIWKKLRKICWQYPLSSLKFKFCLHWFDYLATSFSYWLEILDIYCAKLSPQIEIIYTVFDLLSYHFQDILVKQVQIRIHKNEGRDRDCATLFHIDIFQHLKEVLSSIS